MKKIVPGDLYRHFKGGLYQIVTAARDSDTLEELVVYQALYGDYIVYVKSAEEFFSELDKEKYPKAAQIHRFEPVDRNKLNDMPYSDDEYKSNAAQVLEDKRSNKENDLKENDLQGSNETYDEGRQQYKTTANSKNNEEKEDYREYINPVLEAFLEAEEFPEKLEILREGRKKIDEHVMCSIEISLDLSVSDEDIDDRIARVQKYLMTQSKFDVRRLR